jgi:hypothetical protein
MADRAVLANGRGPRVIPTIQVLGVGVTSAGLPVTVFLLRHSPDPQAMEDGERQAARRSLARQASHVPLVTSQGGPPLCPARFPSPCPFLRD